jgi:hypothetical protein
MRVFTGSGSNFKLEQYLAIRLKLRTISSKKSEYSCIAEFYMKICLASEVGDFRAADRNGDGIDRSLGEL